MSKLFKRAVTRHNSQTGTLIDLHKLQVKTNQLIARISSPPQEETEVRLVREDISHLSHFI